MAAKKNGYLEGKAAGRAEARSEFRLMLMVYRRMVVDLESKTEAASPATVGKLEAADTLLDQLNKNIKV
jgi:hypothetical protein